MFTVDTGNLIIKVKFCHFIKDEGEKKRYITKCNLTVFKPIYDTDLEELYRVETFSVYNPKDKLFGKNLGKKFALTKAIFSIKERLTKSVREAIWSTFLEEFPLEKPVEFNRGWNSALNSVRMPT